MNAIHAGENGVRETLIVVHPGSCCGSADFNLGRYEASGEREYLSAFLDRWSGPVIVIDGSLSDELPDYSQLNDALLGALARAKAAGHQSMRVYGCDGEVRRHQAAATRRLLTRRIITGESPVRLTGAWVGGDGPDDTGCVNSVARVLQDAGVRWTIDDSAIREIDEDDGE